MLAVYLFSLLFGGVLIGVSLLLGGGDADHDHDHDHDHDGEIATVDDHTLDADHDHDHDHDAVATADAAPGSHLWVPFLSMRFWTFFAASFGATGLLLVLLGLGDLGSALIALPNGLVLGTAAAWFFRQLKQSQVTADTGLSRLIGQEAKVVLPIRPGDLGKIVIHTMAGRVEMPARTRDAKALEPGALVLVAHIENGTADVTSMSPTATVRNRQSTEH